MNRSLHVLNFLGVLLLAVLCAMQWRANRRSNLDVLDLQMTALKQSALLNERDKTIKAYMADMDEFRGRITLAESQLKELDGKLTDMARERDALAAQKMHLTAERDALQAALDKWAAAVADRDAEIKRAGEQLHRLMAERNQSVVKFNELATRYNALVAEVNTTRPASRPSTQP